tara:strand:+ start:1956 stop:2891 length:936 start_codon:yes stop_codon:yes gene_type:complete
MKSTILVGGQAVIEGVMMRVPGAYATAVRKSNGELAIDYHKFNSKVTSNYFYGLPIIRGMIHLYESMSIGYKTLDWSANIAEPDQKTNKLLDRLLSIVSLLFSLGLFVGLPILAADFVQHLLGDKNTFMFNLISGLVRIFIFLTYLVLISFMKDIKRLFQFHGAEHKTVYNFESGKPLLIENAKQFSKEHPRCGTSFIFIVMLVSIVSYGIIDSLVVNMGVNLTVINRFLIHIPCLPIVAGFSYEVLKISAKYQHYFFFKILGFPGLMLQKITTQTPDDSQLEVAINALKHAFGNDLKKYEGKEFNAEAVG